MTQQLTPTGINADRTQRIMNISWVDGHTSLYPFELLRAACPCASCRGGHENMRSEADESMFEIHLGDTEQTRIRKIEAVGSYAITIEWEDGHTYGIYTWHYLRSLCPCPECRQKAKSG
jgi:prepilin-type processing-associated H-X9-DG protein